MMESLYAFKRAGAAGVLSYFAPRVAEKAESHSLEYSLERPAITAWHASIQAIASVFTTARIARLT